MIEVSPVRGTGLVEPAKLLEESLRDGEPVSDAFAKKLREAVEAGEFEVLAARAEGRMVGVVVLAYRLSISAAGLFASIEDLYVRPNERRRGVGRALLEAAENRCTARNVSYVEVHVQEKGAAAFYTALGYEAEGEVSVFSRSISFQPPTSNEQQDDEAGGRPL